MLINQKHARAYLLDEASRVGKPRLERVSVKTLEWLERELIKKMDWLVSVHPHSGPKTIAPPN